MLKRAGVVLVLVIAVLFVAPAASPVQLSYVYSDSMEPTIAENDGFLLVPANDVRPGTIVTFRSERRGEYVTHRVVGESERGFITKGDANPSTDQAGGYDHVQRSEIAGRVLGVGGDPIVLPGLGVVVSALRDHRLLLLGVGALAALLSLGRGRSTGRPTRPVVRVNDLLYPLFVAALLGTTVSLVAGGLTQDLTYTAVAGGSDAARTVAVGEPATRTAHVDVPSPPMSHRIVSVDGATITDRTRNGSVTELGLRIPPPTEPGAVRASIALGHYPAVLPRGIVAAAHDYHPVAAAFATASAVLAPLFAGCALFVDGHTPLRAPRSRWLRLIWGGAT